METSLLLGAALACAAGVGYFCLSTPGVHFALWVENGIRLSPQNRRVALQRAICVQGVHVLYPLAFRLLEVAPFRSFINDCIAFLDERGCSEVRAHASVSSVLLFFVLLSIFFGIVLGSFLSGLAIALSLAVLGALFVRNSADKRADSMRLCVPDSIQSMKSCFQAGLSLEQTLEYLSMHSPGEIGRSFQKAFQSLRMGCSASEVLRSLKDEIHAPEFAFVVAALEIQHKTGGSLASVLQDADEAARGQFELERSLRVQTAQARLSARVVSVMPLVLIGIFSLISEGFLEPFFSSLAGIFLFLLAMLMQVAGIVMVRKTLKVKGVVS